MSRLITPPRGMSSGTALSASQEPPGCSGATTVSQATSHAISRTRLPMAPRWKNLGVSILARSLQPDGRLGQALAGRDGQFFLVFAHRLVAVDAGPVGGAVGTAAG